MRVGSLLLLFAFVGVLPSARADVLFSGSVSIHPYNAGTGTAGTPCLDSGTSYGSISLQCSNADPVATASVTGSGDPFSGSLNVDTAVAGFTGYAMSTEVATGELELNETYVLIGGFGPTTVNLDFFSPTYLHINSGVLDCTVTFDGASQACDLIDDNMSFPVDYLVPFSLGLNVYAFENNGLADGGGIDDILGYSIGGPGLLLAIPTPEPSSGYLLLAGFVGVALRRKFACER
jgi:hypothetical protein